MDDRWPFVCPHCASPLVQEERTLRCARGHCFDLAREGYVNLLPANRKHSAQPGDDKEMTAARTRFLDGGWYQPLRDALARRTAAEGEGPLTVVDAGCGEGYYTAGIAQALREAGRQAVVAGVDLSRSALRRAARRGEGCRFAVASVYHLPLADGAAQVLVDCFSPLALEEFRRVLAPGGLFLYVVPARDHLWQLKEVLYPTPYPNPQEDIPYGGFAYEAVEEVDSWMDLGDNQTIRDLFTMTPYRWRTPRQGMERLAQLEGLRVKAAFRIHVFRRQG